MSDGVYTIGKWDYWENYVGKSSGSNNTFTIRQVSDEVLGQYDIWSVDIVATNHTELGKDVRVTLDNPANKGITTVFNGGKYFLTKGAEITPDQLSFTVENDQALSEPYVKVDNAAKTILVNYNNPPEHTTGWFQIAVNSGISGLDDANRMINADEEKRQNASNFYPLMYGPEQTESPAKEFIHITVDERTGAYHFTSLNGHGVQENCTATRDAIPAENPAVTKVSDGVYSIGKWNIWENYVGKSSGSNNTFTISQVSDDVLGQYDVWTVEIIAANHAELGKDVRVTLDNAANKGITTVFNGGTYFLTKGAEITPDQLSFTVENDQVLSEPYVKVDNAAKTILANFNEAPVVIVDATAVILSAESLELAEGETATLVATVEPADTTDPTVVWTSSDENVATVAADGTVTAVAAGSCTVTAACGEVSAVCAVTVKHKEVDSIVEIKADAAGRVYDLQGRRVVNPANGLYIIDGKLIRK